MAFGGVARDKGRLLSAAGLWRAGRLRRGFNARGVSQAFWRGFAGVFPFRVSGENARAFFLRESETVPGLVRVMPRR